MKKLNKDELLLCELQATAFENSIDKMASSSGIFIRRFMKSKKALIMNQFLKVIFRQRIFCK